MPQSLLRLVKRCAEFRMKDEVSTLPHKLRGIYVLYQYNSKLAKYNVVCTLEWRRPEDTVA